MRSNAGIKSLLLIAAGVACLVLGIAVLIANHHPVAPHLNLLGWSSISAGAGLIVAAWPIP
jgi:hypothetical protein